MSIPQAVAARRTCTSGHVLLHNLVESMEASGFIRLSLSKHKIDGVDLADPAPALPAI